LKDVPLSILSANAGLAVAYKLAMLSAPLIVGKGADRLMKTIQANYVMAKASAQEKGALENYSAQSDALQSEFVSARTS
jgi:hypothetical protein